MRGFVKELTYRMKDGKHEAPYQVLQIRRRPALHQQARHRGFVVVGIMQGVEVYCRARAHVRTLVLKVSVAY